MKMKAKFENVTLNFYKYPKDEIIGSIKIDSNTNFDENEIIINDKVYKLIRNKWETNV